MSALRNFDTILGEGTENAEIKAHMLRSAKERILWKETAKKEDKRMNFAKRNFYSHLLRSRN